MPTCVSHYTAGVQTNGGAKTTKHTQTCFKYLCWVEDDVIYSKVPMNQAFFIIIRWQVVC